MVAHEVETIVIVSQPDEITRKQIASSSVEPVHNGKISMRSPLSNAINILLYYRERTVQ